MTLKLDFSEFERAARGVQNLERQMPFMLAYALTKSMQEAKVAEQREMERVFDKPTRYTLNAITVIPATKTNLRAELRFRQFGGTPADKYLGPEVRGGNRRAKGSERALRSAGIMKPGEFIVPGNGAPLDSFGNIRPSIYTQILSALGASTDAMQNRSAKSKRRNKKLKPFFVLRTAKAPPGVYMRSGRTAVPILIFVKAPNYRPRYHFYEVGERVLRQAVRRNFAEGVKRVLNGSLGKRR